MRVVQYPNTVPWHKLIDAAVFFLAGLYFFAVSIPAWFAGHLLPHPLFGLGLMIYAFIHPLRAAARDRAIKIEISDEGLRRDATLIAWNQITRMEVRRGPIYSCVTIRGGDAAIEFPADWEGRREVMEGVISNAHLTRTRTPWWEGLETYVPAP